MNGDLSLLERVRLGDDQAITSLYERYSSVVYSIALRVLRDPALAEQVLSDIFVEIWRSPGRFERIGDGFACQLVVIARNRAVALLLHRPAPELDFAFPQGFANRPETQSEGGRAPDMTREAARAAIDNLPVDRRIMLERAFFHGMTRPEFASMTSNSLATGRPLSMGRTVSQLAGTGLEVIDLQSDPAFARRRLHVRDAVAQLDGMNRLARVFVESPTTILQELATAAVDLCGADSAGISIEQREETDDNYYHWVATAGQYSRFLDAKLPRYPSACGVTLERGSPQLFRVTKRFFDLMGIEAPTVTDGMLLPWQVGDTRGTIWIMAHGRDEAFDGEDCRMMQALANFAATGVRLEQQQTLLMEHARTAAEVALANKLAHQINNPLQALMQTVFLVGRGGEESGAFAQQAMGDVVKLSGVVKRLLTPPEKTSRERRRPEDSQF